MGKLSKRLTAVCRLVSEGNAVLDVGCDHAYVPIELVSGGKAPAAIASDIRSGPIAAAKKHISEAALEEHISACLCDGIPEDVKSQFENLHAPEGKTLILAGMGGLLMRQILDEAGDRVRLFSEIVASPQRDAESFRGFLINHLCFQIIDEEMIKEDGKYYPVIKAVRCEGENVLLLPDQAELRYGPVLLKKQNPVLKEYLLKKEELHQKVLTGLQLSVNGSERTREVEEEIDIIRKALSRFGGV